MGLLNLCCLFVIVLSFSDVATSDTIIVHNPDYSDVVRPCRLTDKDCINSLFNNRGFCDVPAQTQCPYRPLCMKNVISELPTLNATAVISSAVAGLENGVITELYYNKITEVMVLAIRFTHLSLYEYGTIYVHRTGQEDLKIFIEKAKEHYDEIVTTTQTIGCNKFQPDTSKTSLDIEGPVAYEFKGVEDVDDPAAIEFFAKLAIEEYEAFQELNLPRGQYYVDFYIKNIICNPNYCD